MKPRLVVAFSLMLATGTMLAAADVVSPVSVAHAQTATESFAQLDRRPSEDLTDRELRARIHKLLGLVKSPELNNNQRKVVRQLLKSDQQTLRGLPRQQKTFGDAPAGGRQGGAKAAAGNGGKPPAQADTRPEPPRSTAQVPGMSAGRLSDAQLAAQIEQLNRDLGSGAYVGDDKKQARIKLHEYRVELQQRRARAQAQQDERKKADDSKQRPSNEDGQVSPRLKRELADQRPARRLDRADLQDRVRRTQALLSAGDLSRQDRAYLSERLKNDRQALASRTDPSEPDNRDGAAARVDAEARDYLSERRDPSRLDDRELRRRLADARDILGNRKLDSRLREQVDRQFQRERRALRDRLAERRDSDVADSRYLSRDNNVLVDRNVPSSDLSIRELRFRIDKLRTALDSGQIQSSQRRRIARNIIASDRAELRHKLREQRQRRYSDLRERRRRGDLNIAIGLSPFIYPTIPAAEYDDRAIEEQLVARPRFEPRQTYSLREIEQQPQLRESMPGIEIDTLQFASGSALIPEEEIASIERIASVIERIIAASPDEIFLIEGHTDAVGSEVYNDDLSRRRAETVRRVLVEYYAIPDENLRTVGLGERFLKIPTPYAEAENRRVTVRRITPLLTSR